MFIALAGGVGGAKLAGGLAARLPARDLLVVVNTGDDFVHLGLNISPDLDTVTYWLADLNDANRGWGIRNETWSFMSALERLGGPTWFQLGDRDLATHVERTRRLAEGRTLSQVTRELCVRLGIHHLIAPMSDQSVATMVHTAEGPLAFQEYFVRLQCKPAVLDITFEGIESAGVSPAFRDAMSNRSLKAVLICPSNPFLSIAPILSLSGVNAWLRNRTFPVIALSPIVGGQAIKGPAAKLMKDFGRDVSAVGIAKYYSGLVDGLVIDAIDAHLAPAIEASGIKVLTVPSIMRTKDDQIALAEQILAFASALTGNIHA
jgi:LPPG:FO 2-phospho-L-lactate transferase